jgi:hypothetical protein
MCGIAAAQRSQIIASSLAPAQSTHACGSALRKAPTTARQPGAARFTAAVKAVKFAFACI